MLPPETTPIGVVKVGTRLEGALIVDLVSGDYALIDKDSECFDLDQAQVRAALGIFDSTEAS